MSRTENIKKNLISNILKFTTNLVLQFILRTILIYVMGVEYLGLNGLFSNIFAFLNLAELGIGSAIIFSMYKPIAENDTEKIKALQSLYKKFYSILTIIIFVLGLGIMPFIKYLIKNDLTIDINIYILYAMYLASTLIGYLAAHKRSLLFAYQRNDVENKIKTLCIIGMNIIQIIVVLITKNYYFYFSINILFAIIEAILVHFSANKLFPEIRGKGSSLDKDTKKEIVKNVSALSLYKLGGIFVSCTDSILISVFLGAVILGVYSNYLLILTSLISITTLVINSITASVGNLMATNDKEYIYVKFKQINFIFAFLANFMTICLFVLVQPFMKIWTGGGIYLLNFPTMIVICLSFYLNRMRAAVTTFKDCAGLFWKDRWKPIVEALTNLIVSIILVKYFGMVGIFIGTIVSTVVAPLWVEPQVLFKHYFKKSVWNYFKRYILDVAIMLLGSVLTYFICSFIPDSNVWMLIVKFGVCCAVAGGFLIVAYMPTREFRQCFGVLKGFVKNLKNRKKTSK